MVESVTRLLQELRGGDARALPELIAAVAAELRVVAARHLGRERRDHTLQPTALVNEVYLKLIDQRARDFEGRTHFVSIASTAMRRVLVEHARARLAAKRGGEVRRVPLSDLPEPLSADPDAIVALDEALATFAEIDPQGARIVELRWFGGLDVEETAAALAVSTRTIERGYRAALAWLRERLAKP
jgi:RNA polymerase sigma-70 factor, ECF subfamily